MNKFNIKGFKFFSRVCVVWVENSRGFQAVYIDSIDSESLDIVQDIIKNGDILSIDEAYGFFEIDRYKYALSKQELICC